MPDSPNIAKFAADCKNLREVLKMDQNQFARQLGVTARTVSRWECQTGHLPSKKMLEKFRQFQQMNRYEKGDPKPKMNPSKFRK